MYRPMKGFVYVQYNLFSLDVSSPRRISFHLFQSLFLVPSSLYTTLHLQRAVHFLQPILLLTLSKYYCVVLHTLFLLGVYTQTEGGALFLYAPHITCICLIPLIPLSFSMLLFLSCASVMGTWIMFSWCQCCISTSQGLLHYIA